MADQQIRGVFRGNGTTADNCYELTFNEPISTKLLDQLIVLVQVPGIKQGALDIRLAENVLTIKQADVQSAGRSLLRADIVGESRALRTCLDQVAEAAKTDDTVLICGETGTGKELVARAIHQNSRREKENFVVVDCRSLPESMAKKLLFGRHQQEGLLHQAEYGTLLLDEVGDLPLSTQLLFQQLLSERTYRYSGRKRRFATSFRLLATTNRNLDQLVVQRRFRADLLTSLQTQQIEVPPLRNRLEDIDLLTDYYLQRYCRLQQLAMKSRSPEFMDMLRQYPWPGNIRELINTLEQAMLAAKNKRTLFPKDLPAHIRVRVKKSIIDKKNKRQEDQQTPSWMGLLIAENPL